MNKGFTLIELLVVVLIIGILAAIALPQYTKAVERSRTAEAVQKLGDLATAQQIYYMQHNRFATTENQIQTGDISFGPLSSESYTYSHTNCAAQDCTMTMTRNGGQYRTAVLSLNVKPSGAISKDCTDRAENPGLCDLAEAAGY